MICREVDYVVDTKELEEGVGVRVRRGVGTKEVFNRFVRNAFQSSLFISLLLLALSSETSIPFCCLTKCSLRPAQASQIIRTAAWSQ